SSGLVNRYPDRFLFGTDVVAPADAAQYFRVFDIYRPFLERLTPVARQQFLRGNYDRLFGASRKRRRAWEAAHLRCVPRWFTVRKGKVRMIHARRWMAAALLATFAPALLPGQTTGVAPQSQRKDTATKLEIYGFVQGDAIADFGTINPDWFDVMRPTK